MFYIDVFGCVSGSLMTPQGGEEPRLFVHFLTGSSVRPTSCLICDAIYWTGNDISSSPITLSAFSPSDVGPRALTPV